MAARRAAGGRQEAEALASSLASRRCDALLPTDDMARAVCRGEEALHCRKQRLTVTTKYFFRSSLLF